MKDLFDISGYKVRTLDMNRNQIISVCDSQYIQFVNFYSAIRDDKSNKIIFRGNKTPQCQYDENPNRNLGQLASYIFMVGDKGHSFWKNLAGKPQDVNDAQYAEQLYNKIRQIICNEEVANASVREHIHQFTCSNVQFKDYFRDDHKEAFVSILTSCKGGYVNDYYCTILHTLGHSTYPNSKYLSTSLSLKQAKAFSTKYGIVTMAWIPQGCIMTAYNMNKYNKKIEKLGLPTYTCGTYPKQKEICLKYGLLPHFILGFIYQNSFIINPTLFTDLNSNRDVKNLIQKGINIDQTDFLKILRQTNFRRGINLRTGCYLY